MDFVTGAPAADTIQSFDTVLVIARDREGRPIAGQAIVFESTGDGSGTPSLILSEVDGNPYRPYADSTASDGSAGIGVLRGTVVGIAWLRVRLPGFGISDSIPFEIHAGQPAGVRVTPADTALRIGAELTIRASVVDRFDNARAEPVTFTAESSSVSVVGAAGAATVTGLEYGRASILVAGAAHSHRSWVSVVPIGTIAFYLQASGTGDSTGIGLSAIDGSEYRLLFGSPFDYASDRPLDWAPNGESLVFHLGFNGVPFRLFHITLGGAIQRVIPQAIGDDYPTLLPRYGPDGRIYFTVQTNWSTGTDELWRVNADGSSPHRVGLPADAYQTDTYAAPAPDSQHIWFSTDRFGPGSVEAQTLAVLHIDSGTVSSLGIQGVGAVWSPREDRVAFINGAGAIVVVSPDGGEQRVVSAAPKRYVPYLDWSPDGKWIVASWRPAGSWSGGTDIIEPDLGIMLPLSFATQWLHPAWRP